MLSPQRSCLLSSTTSPHIVAFRSQSIHRRRQVDIRIRSQADRPLENKLASLLLGGTALLATALTYTAQPAWADLETVAPATVSSLAKPLPQQKVEKGKVWAVFVLGAAGLFAGTLLLENNEKLFPAISRANKAMAMARQAQQTKAKIEEAIDVDGDADERLQSAVVAGINEARQRAASSPDASSSSSSSSPSGAEAQQESSESQHSKVTEEAGHLNSQQLREDQPMSDRQEKEESELSMNSASRKSNG